MSLDQVQQKALQTYEKNLEYFKQNHPDIYKNLELYAAAIDLGQITPQFELQYLNTHFDIVNPNTKQFLYTQNSNEVSKKIADDISYDATINSFKAYYEFKYNDTVAKTALEQDILAPHTIGNAPVINFVDKNLPNPQNLNEIHKFIIFGVLLGIHIPLIHQKLNSKVYLIVEPNLEFFRLSLFVTDYAELAKQTILFFSIAQNEFEFKKTFEAFYGELFIFNHYLKFVNLSSGSDIYMKTIQNFLVSQAHLLYSYDRTFLSISRTNSYINQNYRLLNIKTKQNIKPFEKPILYLSAGPSLQNNIEFVKKNQNYFTIVAIYATMPILERNDIKPDIITQYDEQDIQVLNTLDKLKDINYFKDTIFIFASHVNAKLMNSFPKENIFIFQAMFELKENFGTLTSPSIGELTYALLLLFRGKEIYLLGLDFAMDVESGDTHIEGHSGSGAFNKLKELEDSDDKNYSFRKNTIIVKGNFLPEVKSVPVFKTSIDTFTQFTEMFKEVNQNVYNLSNGAYLSGTTPLKIEDINFSNFEEEDKKIVRNKLFNSFTDISEAGYNKKDLEKLNLKLSGVKKIKKNIEQFQKIKKYKDFEEYKGQLINLIQNILFEKSHCEDLQSILINYSSHNLHHIFYLFDLATNNDKKKYIYEINKNLLTQLNKIVDTYVISISYSSDDNSLTLKKLNKYLKEYSIKKSIYSEPFFKELVETSKRGYQYEFEPNSIGFFAIEDNLSNKDFINYVKEILKRFPDVQLKLFYFFDFQKTQAQFVFKQELSRVELLIPHNIDDITKSVELWLETYDNTINIKKIDDIILNNYENIYSSMFTQIEYESALNNKEESEEKILTDKFDLAKKIKDDFILPNTKYFEFANSLKFNIDKDLLNEKYLKEHVGFFAIKENLQQEFVNKIVEICNKFPNVKFSVFYFDDETVKEFINIFGMVINRFKFIIPKNIYDIVDNIEVWTQASIKNQSFLLSKIFTMINSTINAYPIILSEEYHINDISTNYLECIIENYSELKFNKSLYKPLSEDYKKRYSQNTISFLLCEDNLNDIEFIQYLDDLIVKYPSVTFKGLYFSSVRPNIDSISTKVQVIKVSSIDDIIKETEIFISNHKTYPVQGEIFSKITYNCENIFTTVYDKNKKYIDINQYDNGEHYILNNYEKFGYTHKDIIKSNNNILKLTIIGILNKMNISNCDITKLNAYDFTYYSTIGYILEEPNLKEYLFKNNLLLRELTNK
ncbi:MAG: 6-hydroxymethylpterin diphosphokinase MptE-like protein [Arcobacter sp.]|uniref:motility associated factor glycosyltransferase family protein n=1 Tax=Arcobacter sp. TaxID=1872629 RepID=UPI003B00F963